MTQEELVSRLKNEVKKELRRRLGRKTLHLIPSTVLTGSKMLKTFSLFTQLGASADLQIIS